MIFIENNKRVFLRYGLRSPCRRNTPLFLYHYKRWAGKTPAFHKILLKQFAEVLVGNLLLCEGSLLLDEGGEFFARYLIANHTAILILGEAFLGDVVEGVGGNLRCGHAVTCKFCHHQLLGLVEFLVGRNFDVVVFYEFVFDEVPLDVAFEVGEVFVEFGLVPILVLFEVEHPTLHKLQRNVEVGGFGERVFCVDEHLVIALVSVGFFKLTVDFCAEFVLVVNLVLAEELVVNFLSEFALDEVGDFVDFECEPARRGMCFCSR